MEFKTSWHDKYWEWICGFANAQGAVMYFGVNDDHEVVGLKQTKKRYPTSLVCDRSTIAGVHLRQQN